MAVTISGTDGIVGAGFTVDNSGVSVTAGVGTFSSVRGTHHGDGANLTSLPAAQLTGTLPAISGANLTGITAGITMADQWRLSANLTMTQNTGTTITANWERVDTDGFAQLGTGMTESSGIFSFPSTGIYLITFIPITYAGTSAASGNRIRIYTTVDDGTYELASETFISNYAQYIYSTGVCEFQFDVTNVSTHKVKFYYYTGGTGVQLQTNSGVNMTHVTFIRLGDT